MGAFFKGWRRKAGSVTLVLACVFTAGWARSFDTTDYLHIDFTNPEFAVLSQGGVFSCCIAFRSSVIANSEIILIETRSFDSDRSQFVDLDYAFPYWSIVVPLTLLSPYLLLAKPRVAKPTIESGSAHMAEIRERP